MSIDLGKEEEKSMNFSSLKAPPAALIMQILLSLPPDISLPPSAVMPVIPALWALMALTTWQVSPQT